MNSYNFTEAQQWASEQRYITAISDMIAETRETDKSVIPHTSEELAERYQSSIITLLDKKIIANASIFRTQIREFEGQNIGELGSVIVCPRHRNHKVWHQMIDMTLDTFSDKYEKIVGATINPHMYRIFEEHGFSEADFPDSCLEEGRKYLSPLLEGWEEEFNQRAKFFIQ